jgi:hypothetical protein
MNTQKQNAILVRDALGKINGYASHDDTCDILRYSACELPGCSCGYTDAWGAVQQALPAAQALVDGVGDGWQDISTAPKDGTPIVVGHLVRYLPYKPDGQRQMKAEGRWQEWNGYGWSNIDWVPTQWMPAPPAMKGNDLC